MGRPSKLSDTQWAEVIRRIVDGKESVRSIAKEFKITEAAIRQKTGGEIASIKTAASNIVNAETSLKKLGVSSQLIAVDLASRLRSISSNMLAAADHQAAITHRLSAIAASHLDRIDESNPMEAQESLKVISGLNSMANDASKIPLGLIAANKEQAQRVTEPEREKALTLDQFYSEAAPANGGK